MSIALRAPARLWRAFADAKPPKGFEKFYENISNTAKSSAEAKTAKPSGNPKNSPEGVPLAAGLALGVLAYTTYSIFTSAQSEPETTFQSFLSSFLYKGQVERIQVVNRSFARVFIRNDESSSPQQVYRIQLGGVEQFEAKLDMIQSQMGLDPVNFVPIQYKEERDLKQDAIAIFPSLVMLALLALGVRNLRGMAKEMGPGGDKGGIFSIRKANIVAGKDLKQKTKFSDVAGLQQAKMEILEFVEFLKSPAKFNHLGAKIPKGALLVGPPGTGKTLLAKAVAGEAGVPFFSMSGSDFGEMFVGVGASRVRDLFAQARKAAPAIVFIDEIDAVGRKRGKGGFGGGGNDERENTLNQLLVEMDGFGTTTGLVVLAGTNRADILDPALTRPGRFDRNIPVEKPDLEERGEIFGVHMKKIKLSKDTDMNQIASRMAALTPGMVGADIANICNEAAIFAARRNAESVEIDDFEKACERILGGTAKSKNLMGEVERKTVALHESGHAVAGWFLEHADPLLKVSIVPRSSGALGFAQYLPEELALYSKEALLDRICVILAGRAAEEVFVGRITTGASDDFQKVTNIAYGMVQMYGMNDKIGCLAWNPEEMKQFAFRPFSDATAEKIDAEVRKTVDEQYQRCKELLLTYKEQVLALSEMLFKKETVVYTDLKQVLGPRPWGIKSGYQKFVDGITEKQPTEEVLPEDLKPAAI